MAVSFCVYATTCADRYWSGRTVRAALASGLGVVDLAWARPGDALSAWRAGDAAWFVRGGAWPVHTGAPRWPRPSATGLPLAAVGLSYAADQAAQLDAADAAWRAALEAASGDLSSVPEALSDSPPASVYLEPPLAGAVFARIARGAPPAAALAAEIVAPARRIAYWPALDVLVDRRWRILQLVTSLQQGGAERLTLELAAQLARDGLWCRVAPLGRPTRRAFASPPGTIDLAPLAGDRQRRADRLAELVRTLGVDLVHAHLLDADEVRRLADRGLPLVVTVHNQRPGWPRELPSLARHDAALVAACSQSVAADLTAASVAPPVRTAWNGIDFASVAPTAERAAAAARLRREWGCRADDFLLVAIANPRPQKRLERLPAILAVTQAELARRGSTRQVRLAIVGEASAASEEAARSLAQLTAAIADCRVEEGVRLVGARDDVAVVLAAADALVSTSAHEGLSLALLEALAGERPAVVTAAGGAAEVACGNRACTVLPLDAEPTDFARALADWAAAPAAGGRAAAAVHFTRQRMAERYRWLYPRAVAATRRLARPRGLLLVTNNFSIGGAQTSARRLLLGLAAQGVPVRAAVLEEDPERPTPGRAALVAAGIEVAALAPADRHDPAVAVGELLARIDADPPQAVLFWNALAQSKLLLADALFDVPLFDVSPGEMFFDSLERYFARPRPGLPYRTPRDYGRRLAGVIVKYAAEAAQAAHSLGAPVHVIPNGVPLDGVAHPAAAGPRPLRIGTATRINPQKRLEELLAAIAQAQRRLPPYELLIAGGVERDCDQYAQRLHEQSQTACVRWLGAVGDVPAFLKSLDLFVMVSEPAGCPNALLEALAVGLPSVATDVGGAGEQVIDGQTGRLVPRADVAALAAAIVELAHDAAQRERLAHAARRHVAQAFSLERMIARYREVCLGARG